MQLINKHENMVIHFFSRNRYADKACIDNKFQLVCADIVGVSERRQLRRDDTRPNNSSQRSM